MKTLALTMIALLALALSTPALADSSAAATITCGQQMSLTFNGFTKTTTINVTVSEDGNQTNSQFTVTGAGTDNLPTAAGGHTWEIYAGWSNPDSTSGIFDSGATSCPAPQTQVTVDQGVTTTAALPQPGGTSTVGGQGATPATADFTANATGNLGEVDYEATTTPGTNPIKTTVWYFGDGASATGTSAKHAYQWPGQYVVTLQVVDTGGLTALVAHEVTVSENGEMRMGPRVPAFGASVIVKTTRLKRTHVAVRPRLSLAKWLLVTGRLFEW